jgi:hypothetical protein
VPNARIEAGRINANQAPEKPVIPRPPGADGPPRGTSGRAWRPDGAVYYGQGLTACGVDHRRGSTTIATGRPSAANRAMRSTAAAAALWQITKYSRPYRRRSVARSSSSSPWSPSRTSSAGSMIAAPPLRWPGAVRPPAVPHGGPPRGERLWPVAACQARSSGGRAFGEGQFDDEPRVAGLGLHTEVATMSNDDDAIGDVQPEPGALTHRFGGKERLEDAPAHL